MIAVGKEKIQADMNKTSEDLKRNFDEADQDENERIQKAKIKTSSGSW